MCDRDRIEVVVANEVDWREDQLEISKKDAPGSHPSFNVRKGASLILHCGRKAESSKHPIPQAQIAERGNHDCQQFLPCLKQSFDIAIVAEKNIEANNDRKDDRVLFR